MAAITNEVYIGSKEDPDYYFLNEDIYSVNGNIACNLVAEELSIDTLEFVIDYEYVRRSVFKPKDYDGIISADNFILCGHYTADIRELPFGTPLWYYNGEKYVGKFYVDSVTRSSKTQYTIKAVSIIGILDKQTFYGGLYAGTAFYSIVKSILLTDSLQLYKKLDYVQTYGENYASVAYYTASIIPNCTVEFNFHYDGLGEGVTAWLTTQTFGIFGCVPSTSGEYPIAIYSKISRDSTSVSYDGKITLFLNYGTQSNIGNFEIEPDTDVNIVLNCKDGTFTVNGETVSFIHEDLTFSSYTADILAVYTESTRAHTGSGIKAKLYDFIITDESGNVSTECVPCVHMNAATPQLFDKILFSTRNFNTLSGGTSPACGNYEPYDYPRFLNCSKEMLSIFNELDFADGVKTQKVYGWIPVCTKREALYQLMFAYNINLVKSEDDAILFTWLMDSDPVEIPDARVYNNGSVTYDSPAKMVEITEHSFVDDTTVDTETLYDNTDAEAVSNLIVTFQNAPIVTGSIATTGSMSLVYYNSNCAIVSGIGTVTGRAYTHNTNIKSEYNTDATDGQSISVTDAYLVNLDNSENVMKRVFSYYTSRKTIQNSIVLSDESAGRHYSFTDPFEETETGWLQSMSINASAILKADCEIITNYTPVGNGSNYTKAVVLTGDGTFTVPDSVFEKDVPSIRIVLIGGGHGGQSGLKGEDGEDGRTASSRNKGGAYGDNGDGGKIYTYTIENPSTSYDYSCGEGGAGGAICYSTETYNEGSDGGDTTFGSYTSTDGATIEGGVHNFFSGAVYGKKPDYNYYFTQAGADGGYISDGYFYWPYPNIYRYTIMGQLIDEYTYGKGCSDFRTYVSGVNESYSWSGSVDGGFPGAPALGSNGGDGTAAYQSGPNTIVQGDGGHGGDAVLKPDAQTTYGCGGYGGCGGGAGGHTTYDSWPTQYGGEITDGTPGTGGYGGEGGDGAPGCIIVYY